MKCNTGLKWVKQTVLLEICFFFPKKFDWHKFFLANFLPVGKQLQAINSIFIQYLNYEINWLREELN